jgi:D-alanyl-D-alanine dipeptidase
MKLQFLSAIFILITIISWAQLPDGFTYVDDEIPSIQTELRYFTNNNFVGKKIDGYFINRAILTKEATFALKKVQNELLKHHLTIKIFDAYRPQKAVNYFVKWAKQHSDTLMKKNYYPTIKKKDLFKQHYIASRSGHSRGSTIDLTLVNILTNEEIDMGTPYDFFGKESWVNYKGITVEQQQNRKLLQEVMIKHGFRNYLQEWWHFTLNNEPFKNTYFNFDIQ